MQDRKHWMCKKVFQEVQGSAKCKTIAESVSAAMYGWKDETWYEEP